MTEMAVTETGAALAEQVIIKGDLSKLTEADRMRYYTEVCRSLGLNPLTRPFEYITLNGRLTLYATRAAGDQLRAIRGITITSLDPRQIGDLFVVVATGRDRTGREDSSTGAVSIKGVGGEALANAMMKAETKAKRRLTLSLAGLGWSDETEVAELGTIEPPPPKQSLAEVAKAKAAEIEPTADDRVAALVAEAPPILQPMPQEVSEELPYLEAPATMSRELFKKFTSERFIGASQALKVAKTIWPDFTWESATGEQFAELADVLSTTTA